MIRPIIVSFLAQKSESAAAEDLSVAEDLLDTLKANAAGCVGMAANMSGVSKRIIAFDNDCESMLMFNPEFLKFPFVYRNAGVCLSLSANRPGHRSQPTNAPIQH